MPVKIKQIIKRALFFILCAAILIATPVAAAAKKSSVKDDKNNFMLLTLWQIDCFEGGKGSRADYLQNIGNKFKENGGCYIKVVSLSPSAALKNIETGAVPDLISFGAGMCGLENLPRIENNNCVWAHGGYCILSVEESADFSDISIDNTVINVGTENLSAVAGLLCGLGGAPEELPTEAYVNLINGKYKYLLGTQRDVFRLKTRNVAFKIKPVTEFNDLYQNISATSENSQKLLYGNKFIEYLKNNGSQLSKIGLMGDVKLYDDELGMLEGINYEVKLISPLSQSKKSEIVQAVENSDVKKLKNLLK